MIASDVGGIPEIITGGETGLLTKPGNEDQIRQALTTLLDDEQLKKKIAARAQKRVQQIIPGNITRQCK